MFNKPGLLLILAVYTGPGVLLKASKDKQQRSLSICVFVLHALMMCQHIFGKGEGVRKENSLYACKKAENYGPSLVSFL